MQGRYASLAAQLAEREEATARRKELSEMARILQKVPLRARGQLSRSGEGLWLVHLVLQIESTVTACLTGGWISI